MKLNNSLFRVLEIASSQAQGSQFKIKPLLYKFTAMLSIFWDVKKQSNSTIVKGSFINYAKNQGLLYKFFNENLTSCQRSLWMAPNVNPNRSGLGELTLYLRMPFMFIPIS